MSEYERWNDHSCKVKDNQEDTLLNWEDVVKKLNEQQAIIDEQKIAIDELITDYKRLESYGYDVISSDLVDRGYGTPNKDFLKDTEMKDGSIITNPPYKDAQEFILKALDVVPTGNKVAMFLKVLF